MTSFRIATHAVTGQVMVEVWDDGDFIAAVYPAATRGVTVVSKYALAATVKDDDAPNVLSVGVGR